MNAAQQAAIVEHMPMLKRLARRMAKAHKPGLSVCDAESSAYFGACMAIERFDPSKAASLKTFLYQRAHGQIIDDMRSRFGMRGTEGGKRVFRRMTRQFEDGEDDPSHEPAQSLDELDAARTVLNQSITDRHRRHYLWLVAVEGWTRSDVAKYAGYSLTSISHEVAGAIQEARARWS